MIRQYAYADFRPLERLQKQKTAQGARLSVVIPARNEARTIGPIVRCIRRLQQDVGLVDEIVVMDGNSADATADIAQREGAHVHNVSSVYPQVSLPEGKGVALWKSLLMTSGDIILCVDADIENFDARFIYGLLGPLLLHDDILFAKAFYRRPLALDNREYEEYGGRVTEILVRPLLSMFYPELARLYQPLAGEYAFRRLAVEQLSLSSGYGVEISMLLEIYARWGIEAFAQVDMEKRRHRNRTVADLGKIAHGVLNALLRTMEREKKLSVNGAVGKALFVPENGGWREEVVTEQLLEPIASFDNGESHA